MNVQIPCPFCNGSGLANNPPVFYSAGETPEASENCRVCDGKGYIDEANPEGLRVAMLVSKKIVAELPNNQPWQTIYVDIVSNISNAVSFSMAKHRVKRLITNGNEVFSEEPLPIDSVLERWIDHGGYMQEAKTLLGFRN